MSRNSSLWLHVRGQQCVPVSDVYLAQELQSGTMPADALVWIPGQRCWVQVDSLPGHRSPHETPAPPVPLIETPAQVSRVPPAVVIAGAGPAPTVVPQKQPLVPEQASDVTESVTDVTVPRVVLTREASLVGVPVPGGA